MPTTPGSDDQWRSELVAFLDEHLPAHWRATIDTDDSPQILAMRRELDAGAFVHALGSAGWVAPHWPIEHGGRGLDERTAREIAALLDDWEVPRTPRGSGLQLAAPTIRQWSSEQTKRRFLPPIVTGQETWCQLFSEPGAGSDLASLATTATRDGDEWVVNGQKVWTTLGHEADFAMLLARTDPGEAKHKGITYFGLEMSAPGVEVRPLVNMAGQVEFNEVFLSDARIPDEFRISAPGEGWGATHTTLGAERFALSGGRKKKRKASDEILGGKTMDQVIALARDLGVTDEPAWRQRLAQEWTHQRLLKLTGQRAKANSGGPEGSIGKIAKAKWNQSLQVLAMDLLGVRSTAWDAVDDPEPGTPEDYVEQFLRTRANSIEGGTSEIQRNIVGERVLGLPREPDPWRGQPWKDVPRS